MSHSFDDADMLRTTIHMSHIINELNLNTVLSLLTIHIYLLVTLRLINNALRGITE